MNNIWTTHLTSSALLSSAVTFTSEFTQRLSPHTAMNTELSSSSSWVEWWIMFLWSHSSSFLMHFSHFSWKSDESCRFSRPVAYCHLIKNLCVFSSDPKMYWTLLLLYFTSFHTDNDSSAKVHDFLYSALKHCWIKQTGDVSLVFSIFPSSIFPSLLPFSFPLSRPLLPLPLMSCRCRC